jgi:hypothetical protein
VADLFHKHFDLLPPIDNLGLAGPKHPVQTHRIESWYRNRQKNQGREKAGIVSIALYPHISLRSLSPQIGGRMVSSGRKTVRRLTGLIVGSAGEMHQVSGRIILG